MLPKIRKNETGKQYAHRLIFMAEVEAIKKARKESKKFLNNWIGKGSYLRQLFDKENNLI